MTDGTALAQSEAGPPAHSLEGTAVASVAAQARAAVESRYLMAIQRPRDIDRARLAILEACKRPSFAQSAEYRIPRGGSSIKGPSIRLAEECLRGWQNVYIESMVVYDDDTRRVVRITATDLEANVSYPSDIVIEKTVERRSTKRGDEVVGTRTNSTGDQVWIIKATEGDLMMKQNALASKAIRTNGLRLIPGDIVEEALARCRQTVADGDAKDPKAARKQILEAFHGKGVGPKDVEAYIGKILDQMTVDDLEDLRGAYTALKENTSTWDEIMEARHGDADGDNEFAKARTKDRATALKGKMGKGEDAEALAEDKDLSKE